MLKRQDGHDQALRPVHERWLGVHRSSHGATAESSPPAQHQSTVHGSSCPIRDDKRVAKMASSTPFITTSPGRTSSCSARDFQSRVLAMPSGYPDYASGCSSVSRSSQATSAGGNVVPSAAAFSANSAGVRQ